MATKENIIIEYTVDTTQLESAIDLMLRLGQVDKKTADDFKAATKSYNERTNAINQQTAAIEGEEKALQGLNQVAKKSMEGILNASQAELVEGALLGIQDALDEVGLSAKELSGAPAQSLRGITKEIKALQAESLRLREKGDLLGADKAIQKAGELEDKIGDLRDMTKAYASDTRKLDAVVQGVTAISSAYQVAAGAQALLGGNSKEWEKSLVKLNAVMAITNGLQQIQNLLTKDSALTTNILIPLQKAWTLALGQSTGALRLMRGALISLGIGAVIAGIVLLIQNWENLFGVIKKTTEAQDDYNKSLKESNASNEVAIQKLNTLNSIFKDTNKSISERRQAFNELKKDLPELSGLEYDNAKAISATNAAIKRNVELLGLQSEIRANEQAATNARTKAIEIESEAKNEEAGIFERITNSIKTGNIFSSKEDAIQRVKNEKLKSANDLRTEATELDKKRAAIIENINKLQGESVDIQKRNIESSKVLNKRVADAEKVATKGIDTTNAGLDERTQAELDRLSVIIDANYKTQEQIAKNEKYFADLKAEDEKERIEAIKDYTVSQFETISQAIFQINQNRRDVELGNALSALEEEKNKLLANKRLTDKKRAAIEEEYRKKEAQIKTDAFKKDQQARVTEAIIAGALAVVKALPNYVLAAAAAVTTAAQVAVIKSQPVPKFAKGVERLTGAGTETSDSIHAMLSRGERVVPARINEKYFPALTAIHNGKVTPEYANAMLSMPEYIGLDNKSALLLSASRNTLDYKELSRHLAHELKESNEGVIDTLRDGIYVKNLKELKSSNNYDIRRR